jgi:hypothetical protein
MCSIEYQAFKDLIVNWKLDFVRLIWKSHQPLQKFIYFAHIDLKVRWLALISIDVFDLFDEIGKYSNGELLTRRDDTENIIKNFNNSLLVRVICIFKLLNSLIECFIKFIAIMITCVISDSVHLLVC